VLGFEKIDSIEVSNPMIVRRAPALRRAVDNLRRRKVSVALVPTIGALNDGHAALVSWPKAAR